MKKIQFLHLLCLAVFLIITFQTYVIEIPVNNKMNTSIYNLTGTTSATITTSDDNNIIENIYRAITAIATGGVIAGVIMFFLKNKAIENQRKLVYTGYKK